MLEMKKSYPKDMLSLLEWSKAEIEELIQLAMEMKTNPKHFSHALSGKILGLIFDKPSTRTRVSFEAGMLQLGGQAIMMNGKELQLGRGEPIADTAKVLSSYIDALMIRTFSHEEVEALAEHATIPVINGLTDLHHPCQALADLLTMYEWKDDLANVKVAFIGDGNNVCHSLLLICALMGITIHCAIPDAYQIDATILEKAHQLAAESGAEIVVTADPVKAVTDADFIYTDVWTSMGQEKENQTRMGIFYPTYQVNTALAAYAKPDYKFLHCLPAHREEEVTAEIIDGEHSVCWQQAENRLHAQKALLQLVLQH